MKKQVTKMATSDLTGDFGQYLDANIQYLSSVVDEIRAGVDWARPVEFFEGQLVAMRQARAEFWDVVGR